VGTCFCGTEFDDRIIAGHVKIYCSKRCHVRAATIRKTNRRQSELKRDRFKRRYTINDNFFDVIGEEQAWLLGLLASDGCVHNDRAFSLSQSSNHGEQLIREVQRILSHTGNILHCKNAFSITITSEIMVQRLANFGIVPRKTLTYTFPDTLPVERYAAFLRGYIEGDGSTGIYQTKTATYPCISFVGTLEFISRCNEFIPVVGSMSHIKRARNLYDLRFNGRKAFAFANWIWKNPNLPHTRKQQTIEDFFALHPPRHLEFDRKRIQALQLLEEGLSPEKVADRLGLAFQTIYRWRKMSYDIN
jgi:hypothetical protein